jgi:hypothetical protein
MDSPDLEGGDDIEEGLEDVEEDEEERGEHIIGDVAPAPGPTTVHGQLLELLISLIPPLEASDFLGWFAPPIPFLFLLLVAFLFEHFLGKPSNLTETQVSSN